MSKYVKRGEYWYPSDGEINGKNIEYEIVNSSFGKILLPKGVFDKIF